VYTVFTYLNVYCHQTTMFIHVYRWLLNTGSRYSAEKRNNISKTIISFNTFFCIYSVLNGTFSSVFSRWLLIFRRKLSKLDFDLHFCIMTSVWDFSNPPFYWMISKPLKMTWGKTRENPFFDWMNLIRAKK